MSNRMAEDIYEREKDLDLNKVESIAVIGCGGIGSWIAVNFAIYGVKKIVLVDYDVIEKHNLNRTLFKLEHINEKKTKALSELILERREDIDITMIDKKIEDINEYEDDTIKSCDVIFDCRDRKDKLKYNKVVQMGYDGFQITFSNYQLKIMRTNDERGYSITPSFLLPPLFLSTLALVIALDKKMMFEDKIFINKLNVRDLIRIIKYYDM